MAHGLACVAYDCVAGPADIIRDGENGILVEEGNAERFARELDLLIEDAAKRERLGSEAVKIRDRLHVDTIFEEYRQFIFSTSKKSSAIRTMHR
jgi:glycosyltransferase involved in cell wall biosynthesis